MPYLDSKLVRDFKPKEIDKIMESGRLWEARDICLTLIGHLDYNEALYNLTGEIFFKMNDHPRAGLYWMMTSRDDATAIECINWAMEVYKTDLPNRYKLKTKYSRLPSHIKQRVDKYFKQAGIIEGEAKLRRREFSNHHKASKFEHNMIFVGCFGIVIIIILGFLYGVFQFFTTVVDGP